MADEATEFEPITSQEQLDGILKGRLAREREKATAKFADYDELKAKAAKFDEADRVRDLKAKVSKATGVPADLISGADEESMTAFGLITS